MDGLGKHKGLDEGQAEVRVISRFQERLSAPLAETGTPTGRTGFER